MRRLALVLPALLALLVGHPAHAQTPQSPFVGLVSEDAFNGKPAYRAKTVKRIAALGVGTVRQTMDWSLIQPKRRVFHWGRYDSWVTVTARNGIRVLPIVFNPPDWASRRPARGAKRGTYPPRNFTVFAAFARRAAARYGPNGSFWKAHPEVPYLPIRSWQIWNEPNLPVYWQPRPSAKQYVGLLRATASAIRAVDPTAEILTAGLPKSKLGIPLETYVKQIIDAGGAPYFDTLAVNPYAQTASGVLEFLDAMRAALDADGATDKGLYATEFGWSSQPSPGHFQLGPKGQAQAIRQTMTSLWAARDRLKLRGVVYFNYRDAPPYAGGKDFWGLHTGLLTKRNRAKPALRSFGRAIATLR